MKRIRDFFLGVLAFVTIFPPLPASAATSFDGAQYVTMLDSAFAPTLSQIRSSGTDAWAGYLPAPSVYHAWSSHDWQVLLSSGVPELAVYVVNQNDYRDSTCNAEGHDAVHWLHAYGLHSRVSPDIEYAMYQNNQAGAVRCTAVFGAAVAADGASSFPYAPLGLLRALDAGSASGSWLANWTNHPVDPEQGPLNVYKWSGTRATQYQGGHTVAGVDVDSSTVDVGIFGGNVPRHHTTLNAPIVGSAATARLSGASWEVGADGGVFALDGAPFYGSMGNQHLNAAMAGIASTADGLGYWLTAKDGGVFSFGDAPFRGSMGGTHLNAPVVGIARSAAGGYWLFASDGGVFSFGAPFFGSEGGTHLNAPIVGGAATATGSGYYLVAADGGVFTFGDASFYGSMGGTHLNAAMVGFASTSRGYYLVAADGGVFTFGDASFYGSMAGQRMNAAVASVTEFDGGYALIGGDGGSFNFGSAHVSSLVT